MTAGNTSEIVTGGKVRKRLREALLKFFPRPSDIRMVLNDSLGQTLEQVAGGENYTDVVFELVEWLWRDLEGRLKPFLEEAKINCKASTPELVAIADSLAYIFEPPSYSLHETIQTFLTNIESRRELFSYLNAYKEMHEVLHEISLSRLRFCAAVNARLLAPEEPLAVDIGDSLSDWASRASQANNDTEFPDKPPAWIAKLSDSTCKLSGAEPKQWETALEQLQNIPRREMSRLNDKLIDNAQRLHSEELIEDLNAILDAAKAEQRSSKVIEIESRVSRFRDLCVQLVQLVKAHNLCQEADDFLREAAGLNTVTAKSLMEWSDINENLCDVDSICPSNFRVSRTLDAARKFGSTEDEAQATSDFAVMKSLFNDMFHEMDRDLLKTLNRICSEVLRVTKLLEEYR